MGAGGAGAGSVVMMGDADAAEEGLDDVQQPRLDRLKMVFFSLPMMRSLRNGHPAALKVLLMTDSEHVTFTLLRFLAVDEDDVPLHC